MRKGNQVSKDNTLKVLINYNLKGKLLNFNSGEILIELFKGLKVGKECVVRIAVGNKVIDVTGLIVMSSVSSLTQENVIYLTKIKLEDSYLKRNFPKLPLENFT